MNEKNTRRPRRSLLPCIALACAAITGTARADDANLERHDAVVRILTSQFRLSDERAEHIVEAVEGAAGQLHVPISLILAIIQTESGFNPRATSRAGAIGLMQVMPATHHDFAARGATPADIRDPAGNVYIGTSILRRYIDDADGDMQQALARYSGGTHGYARKVYARWRYFSDFADPGAPPVANVTLALRLAPASVPQKTATPETSETPDTQATHAASRTETSD